MAGEAVAKTDWARIDAMTDDDIRRQIAENPDAAPDLAPELDVRAIRRRTGMSQAEFASAFGFSVRTLHQWERGSRRPTGAARVLLLVIDHAPDVVRKALAAAA